MPIESEVDFLKFIKEIDAWHLEDHIEAEHFLENFHI